MDLFLVRNIERSTCKTMLKSTHIGIAIYILFLYLIVVFMSATGSVDALKVAIKQKNVDAIDTYVDFDSLRKSWKQQVKLELFIEPSFHSENGVEVTYGVLREVILTSNLVENFIDTYVSKAGLLLLFRSLERRNTDSIESKANKLYHELSSEKFVNRNNVEFVSWNKFIIRGFDSSDREYLLEFTLSYYRWILTDIVFDSKYVEPDRVINFIKLLQKEGLI